ncbi:hypothetical protein [Streptomyces sp. 150FB]|uniref:hypothetical protein n=1 Tax=Streptomyces sp. 150FB TaxID=1576605 RepID=UPI0012376F26|nr:hypothetical protein [Streptomyces sp. 150FB]
MTADTSLEPAKRIGHAARFGHLEGQGREEGHLMLHEENAADNKDLTSQRQKSPSSKRIRTLDMFRSRGVPNT